jgi:hypothetical protein
MRTTGIGTVRHKKRYLLVDSRVVETTHNARLQVGDISKHSANPLLGADKAWEP